MTNREAISHLKTWRITGDRSHEALDMAISALQAQELSKNSPKLDKENGDLKPTCNKLATDTISRQEVVDAINEICERCGEGKKYNGVMCGACNLDGVADVVEDLPSAQPDWNEMLAQTHWAVWEDGSLPRNFCPHCGADLRGNENDQSK